MRLLVRKLDELIRRCSRVFEFNQDADCLLRLQVTRAPHTLQLPDLIVEANEPVLLIHLWNERMPHTSPGGADLAWARRTLRLFRHSLYLTADYLRDNRQLIQVRAVGGITILLTSGLRGAGGRFVQEMGFSITPYSSRLGRFGEFWENFYSWLIIWAFNPGSLPDRSLIHLQRSEMWMSREAFMQRYGAARESPIASLQRPLE
jgi:hypothetical protein